MVGRVDATEEVAELSELLVEDIFGGEEKNGYMLAVRKRFALNGDLNKHMLNCLWL